VRLARLLSPCFKESTSSSERPIFVPRVRSFTRGASLEVKKSVSVITSLSWEITLSAKPSDNDETDFNSDYGPNDQTDLAAEKRGLSSFDQRHKVVVAGRDSRVPWQRVVSFPALSWRRFFVYNSAHPFINLLAGTNVNNDRHSTTDRPPGVGRNTGNWSQLRQLLIRALSWQVKSG